MPGKDRLAYPNRKGRNADAKELIGKMIASQIPNGASIFIDIGTTMAAVAESLINHKNLKIITNNTKIGNARDRACSIAINIMTNARIVMII